MTSPLPIIALHHVARASSDPEASKAFYRDVLGFREIERPNFQFRGAWLHNYGVQIHIIEKPSAVDAENQPINTRSNHLAFHVSDLAPVVELLRARQIPFHDTVNAGGIRQIFFHDPDGHHIEIGVYPETPPEIEKSSTP